MYLINYIVTDKNSLSSCRESETLHFLSTAFPVVPLFYAIKSLEQFVSMMHCHTIKQSCRGKTGRTVTFYGIAVIMLITLTVWECNIIIARTKHADTSKIQVVE